MMILIVGSNARKIFQNINPGFLQDLRIPDTRTLENPRGAIRTGRNDDHLASLYLALSGVCRGQILRVCQPFRVGLVHDAVSPLLSIKQNLQDLFLHQHMEVRIVSALQLRMQVSMSGVLPPSIEPDITIITLNGIVLIEILQIVRLGISQLGRCFDKGIFGAAARVSAFGDVDRTVEAMAVFVPLTVVCLELRTRK